jgi:glycerol-3-phosphate dehydrogenase
MEHQTFDIVVVGGGVTGCGAALDAAGRGLSVALVEQRDYGSGTSSRSSKLFHGGLRYLEQGNFALVREALAERNLMFNKLCPHLVEPVSFLYPLKHFGWERLYVGAGVFLYDLMAARADSPLPRHRHLTRKRALDMVPALDSSRLRGAIQYWDAMVDDARHTMTLARTAAAHGARLASSTRVTGMVIERGHVSAVEALDLESGRRLTVRARSVVNATGVWSDDLQEMAGDRGLDVQASKGIHLVVPRQAIQSTSGIILRTAESVLFVIPWRHHWIIGTTDTPWALHRAHPAASKSDIEYLLGWVNTVLATPVVKEDIVGVYAGLRPLLVGESETTSRLSREHAVLETETGLVSIAGGKYTTYRVMARDAVDAAVAGLPETVPSSRTHETPLVGADRHQHLAALVGESPELGEPVVADALYRKADVVYAVTHEGALHLDDVLTRRTRISIETAHRGAKAARPTAEVMAGALRWSHSDVEREITHYLARVDAELDSQEQPDDRTADAARMGAPDVRTGRSSP